MRPDIFANVQHVSQKTLQAKGGKSDELMNNMRYYFFPPAASDMGLSGVHVASVATFLPEGTDRNSTKSSI